MFDAANIIFFTLFSNRFVKKVLFFFRFLLFHLLFYQKSFKYKLVKAESNSSNTYEPMKNSPTLHRIDIIQADPFGPA